ncbi:MULTISPECIES: hypothetical protein [Streptomyces]|uniref:hypothetical protein n=1 Tax=Streptomyces TaxID=1883 RepID=UPI0029AA91FE|nr:hypothetical protein [Streptomyces sp. ME02-6978.2a]MDX3360580.1 hypothetical protein [Streptomyces sp. ME02-6978.2a]
MSEPTQVTRPEAAVEEWLLTSAVAPRNARKSWDEGRTAALRCGKAFTSVCIPARLVYAGASSTDPGAVADYLRGALCGGPVIVAGPNRCVHTLMPTAVALWWSAPETTCAGRGTVLNVPRPDVDRHAGARTYWAVPPDRPGALCSPVAVTQLVAYTRFVLVTAKADSHAR